MTNFDVGSKFKLFNYRFYWNCLPNDILNRIMTLESVKSDEIVRKSYIFVL